MCRTSGAATKNHPNLLPGCIISPSKERSCITHENEYIWLCQRLFSPQSITGSWTEISLPPCINTCIISTVTSPKLRRPGKLGCKWVPLISKGWKDTTPRAGRTHGEGITLSTKGKVDKARIPWDEPWGSMPGSKLRPIAQLKASTLMYTAWATKKRSRNPLHSKQNMY